MWVIGGHSSANAVSRCERNTKLRNSVMIARGYHHSPERYLSEYCLRRIHRDPGANLPRSPHVAVATIVWVFANRGVEFATGG